MKINVLKMDGNNSDNDIELNENIYGIEPNDHVISLAVKAEMSNIRQGTHKAKTRAEVSGGGKKPWRQKGRGTARSGSSRSPIWVGGGKAFGPRPHEYKLKLNKKVKKLARKGALSYKAKNEKIIILEELSFETPKTKDFVAFLELLKLSNSKLTILVDDLSENLYLASRNIPNVFVLEARYASTYDILDCEILLMDKASVETINSILDI